HDGYVTGPKTMPAIPTQNVDAVEVFAPEEAQGLTILERHQRQTKAKKEAAEKERIEKEEAKRLAKEAAEAAPEGYEKAGQGVLKKILPYPAGQVTLAETDMDAVAEGVKS